jgi:predicted Zn-dependent protease
MQNDHAEALREIARGEAIEPTHPFINVFRAQILFNQGNVTEAESLLMSVLSEHPHLDGVRPLLAVLLASQEKKEAAMKNLLPATLKKAEADYDVAYWVASAYSLLGETDLAFEWLERSIRMGLDDKNWFLRDASLSNLRTDPRFELIINKL